MAMSRYQQAASGFLPTRSVAPRRGRTPVLEGDTTIRPAARPTDPYTRVGPTPRSPLWDVAKALSEFESSLGGLVRKEQAEHNAAEAARAEAEFIQNNQQGYAEAVRSGAVPAHASPAFKDSYRAAEGRRIAREAAASIMTAYQSWDGKEADDTTGFAPWVAEQTRTALAGVTDPKVLQAAIPGIQQMTERLGYEHSRYVGDRVMDRAVDGVGKDIQGAIDNAAGEPVPGPDGKLTTYEGLSDAIAASIENGRNIGIPEERLQKIAVDSTIAKAIVKRDFDLLKALPPDLASTPYAAQEIAEAHDKIATAIYRDETRAERLSNIEEKRARDSATRAVIEGLSADIDAAIPEEVLVAGEAGDPQFRIKAEEMRNKMRANLTKVDPQREIDASVRIHTADDPLAQVQIEIEAGNIGSPSRVSSMLNTAQRLKNSRERGANSIIASPAAKQYEKALRSQFSRPDVLTGRSAVDESGYGAALVDYHIALTEWEAENPSASSIDRMKAARDIGESIVAGVRSSTSDTPTPTRATPQAQRPQQPEPSEEQPEDRDAPAEDTRPAALIDEIRRANPALKDLPDSVIRKYLPTSRDTAPASDETSNPSFQRFAGTPLAVPRVATEAARANTYTGPTYEPASADDKFEAEGLDIVYAAEPGSRYGKSATRHAKPFTGLVFHHTGTNVPVTRQVQYGQRVDKKRGGQFGYHFYIDREGNIIQGAPLSKRTNHLQPMRSGLRYRNVGADLSNENALSVSLAGDGRNPTTAQMEAARKLGAAVVSKYGIPSEKIFGHGELQRSREGSEGLELATDLRTR